MALFGGKRTVLQRVEQARWRNDEDRRETLQAFRDCGISAGDTIAFLFHEDPSVRQVAVELFAAGANVGAALSLARQIDGKPSAQRTFATRVFGQVPSQISAAVVQKLLDDRSERQQRLGWEITLSLEGAAAVPWLSRAVVESPVSLRAPALRRLIQAAPASEIVDPLLAAATSDDVRMTAPALEALATVDDPRVSTLMLELFQSQDAAVREHAQRWLAGAARREPKALREQMLKLLAEGEDATRRACIEVLLSTGDPAEILTELFSFMHDLLGWIRTRIVQTLQTFDDRLLNPTMALLVHPNEDVRATALMVAESFNDPRLVGPLCRMLGDPDWWLKVSACDSLGQLGDARAVPFLVQALDDPDCCWAAIDALGRIADPSALAPLTRFLTSDREELRMEAVNACAGFPDQRMLQVLEAIRTQDAASQVRTRASEVARGIATKLRVPMEQGAEAVAVTAASMQSPMDQLLVRLREIGGSDLHIAVDEPPLVRQGGKLDRLQGLPALEPERTKALVELALSERQLRTLEEVGEVDFCYSIPEVGRYRANAFIQRKGTSATFRAIPNVPPTFAELRLPGHLTEVLDYHQGLIAVSGPASSGKSTTLAALINLINETKAVHIVTLEEPIEFVHPPKTGLVNQREVGKHTLSFARALRGALREDPDVIMVGELRDPETIRLALEAAETGHVVITTMHTTSAVQTIERLVTGFPPEEQPQVRMGLSDALKWVVCQSLVPRSDGQGRVAVFEVLKGTFSVGNRIRDDKTFQIPSLMQIGRNLGMQTVDMALQALVESDLVSAETAWRRAENQDAFAALCSPEFIAEMAQEVQG